MADLFSPTLSELGSGIQMVRALNGVDAKPSMQERIGQFLFVGDNAFDLSAISLIIPRQGSMSSIGIFNNHREALRLNSAAPSD